MDLEYFFQLLENELVENKNIAKYHRFTNSKKLYKFRKSYLFERYQFLIDSIEKPNSTILDLGCGYATTAILLTLLGHKVHGITLEYYFNEIEPRLEYWSKFGDLTNLTFEYKNFFDYKNSNEKFDYIIAIDTLHHIEPIQDCFDIIYSILIYNGKLIVCEENGNNIITNLKHFKERGFKKITTFYDERLNKELLFGNENTRSFKEWNNAASKSNLSLVLNSLNYIRFFHPSYHNKKTYEEIVQIENQLWKKNLILREYFFFGINFCLSKQS
jgi:SAM-dependent methyltransferase